MQKSNHIQQARLYWGLSQPDLAALLNLDQSRVSRIESGGDTPTLAVAFALQVLFGYGPRATFPELYAQIEEQVMRRAAALDRSLPRTEDRNTVRKRRMLERMMARATKRKGT